MKNIGESIKKARLAKEMTLEQLGDKLGLQKSVVAKYEKNKVATIPRDKIKILHDVLGISYMDLLGISSHDTNNNDIMLEIENLNLNNESLDRLLRYAKLLKEEENDKK